MDLKRPVPRINPDDPFPFRRDVFDEEGPLMPAGILYWLMVSFLIAATTVGHYFYSGAVNPSELMIGMLVAVMILPGLQLGASVLTALIIAFFYPEKQLPLARVGKITVWSFTGTMIGLVGMAGCCGIFSLVR
jgi:hypothetical protein